MRGRDTIYHGREGHDDDIHRTPSVFHIKNPDVAHEMSDVSVKPIAIFVAGLFIFTAVICLLVYGLFQLFEKRAEQNELKPSPVARQGDERLPPSPRLQAAPGFRVEDKTNALSKDERNLELKEPQAEMKAVRKLWDHDLNNYGLIESQPGRVRIPIEEAKKLMLKREAERTKGATTTQGQSGNVETTPSASSSGQQSEQRHQ